MIEGKAKELVGRVQERYDERYDIAREEAEQVAKFRSTR